MFWKSVCLTAPGQVPRTSNIPHVELEALMEHRLDVEALRGHSVGNVLIGKLLERGGFARVVETQHQDAELLLRLLELAQQRKQPHPVQKSRACARRVCLLLSHSPPTS